MDVVVENLTKSFRNIRKAVDSISFTARKEVKSLGFLGPNGAGKTTIDENLGRAPVLRMWEISLYGDYSIRKQARQK